MDWKGIIKMENQQLGVYRPQAQAVSVSLTIPHPFAPSFPRSLCKRDFERTSKETVWFPGMAGGLKLLDAVDSVFRQRCDADIPSNEMDQTIRSLYLLTPRWDKIRITKLSDDTSKGISLKDSLVINGYKYEFNAEIVEKVLVYLNANKPTVYDVSIVLFQALSFIFFHDSCTNKEVENMMSTCIRSLDFVETAEVLIEEILKKLVHDPEFKWEGTAVFSIMCYYQENRRLTSYYFPTFFNVVKKCLKSKEDGCADSILATLWGMFVEDRPLIDKTKLDVVFDVIEPFVNKFQMKALAILAIISKLTESPAIRDAYTLLPAPLCENYLKDQCETITVVQNKSAASSTLPDVFSFQYEFVERKEFENGFMPLPEEFYSNWDDPTSLYSDDFKRLMIEVRTFLSDSSIDCVKYFFSSFVRMVLSIESPAGAICYYGFLLNMVSQFDCEDVVRIVFDGIDHPTIFNEEHIVYCEGTLDRRISLLRNVAIEIIMREKNASLLQMLLNRHIDKPFLLAEDIGRVMSHCDDKSIENYMSEVVIEAVLNVSFLLQNTEFTKELQTARNVIFLFLLRVAKTPFFATHTFAIGFTRFLFECNISNHILLAVKEGCSVVPDEKSNDIVICIDQILRICADRSNDPNYANLVIAITKMVHESVRLNPSVLRSFWRLFDTIMWGMEAKPSKELLMLITQLIAIAPVKSIRSSHMNIISSFIKSECSDDSRLFYKILNLVAYSDIYDEDSFLPIDRPSMIQLGLACYGNSPRIGDFLRKFKQLVMTSPYAIRQCHEGDLDFILLEFLAAESEETSLFYNGVVITFKISETIQNETVIPLLIEICTHHTSEAIVKKVMQLAGKGNAKGITLLSQIIAAMQNLPIKFHRIGSFAGNHTATGITGADFNEPFTICCRVRIDSDMVKMTNATVNVIHFEDEWDCSLSISMNATAMIVRIERGTLRTVVQVVPCVKYGIWFSLVIVFGIRNGVRVLNTFVNEERLVDAELANFDFDDDPMTLTYGKTSAEGHWLDKEFGYVSDIRFCKRVMTRDDVKAYVMHPEMEMPDVFEFTNHTGLVPTRSFRSYISQMDLVEELVNGSSVKRAGHVLSLLKPLYLLSGTPRMSVAKILKTVESMDELHDHLYFCICSVFDVLEEKKEWFNDILSNFYLLEKYSDLSKQKILNHWCTVMLSSCRDLMSETSYFVSTLEAFSELYRNGSVNGAVKDLFILLLKRMAYIKFTPEDQIALMDCACCEDSVEMMLIYLDIIKDAGSMFNVEVAKQESAKLLELMIRMENTDVVQAVIMCLLNLSYQVDSMVLVMVLTKCVHIPVVLDFAVSNLENWAKLFDIACFLGMVHKDVTDSIAALPKINKALSAINTSDDWLIWPLIWMYQLDEPSQALMLSMLAIACRGSPVTVRKVVNLLKMMNATVKAEKRRPAIASFLAKVSQLDRSEEMCEEVVTLCVRNFLFHSTFSTHSSAIMRLFSESPFELNGFTPDVKVPIKMNIASIEDLKEYTEYAFDVVLHYGVRFNENNVLSDVDYLDIASEIISREITNKYADIVAYYRDYNPDEMGPQGESIKPQIFEIEKQFNDQFREDVVSFMNGVNRRILHAENVMKEIFEIENDGKPWRKVSDSGSSGHSIPSSDSNSCLVWVSQLSNYHTAKLRRKKYFTKIGGKLTKGANCVVVFNDAETECFVKFTSKFVKMQFEEDSLIIPHTKIDLVVVGKSKCTIDIYLKSGRTYYITTKDTRLERSVPKHLQQRTIEWKSNFDYIMLLNLLSGRSFSNKDLYPLFPSIIADWEDINRRKIFTSELSPPVQSWLTTDLEDSLTNAPTISPEFFCFPELVKGPLPKWAASKYDLVYMMRRRLEDPSMTVALKQWVSLVWGRSSTIDLGHKILFSGDGPDKQAPPVGLSSQTFTLTESRLVYASARGSTTVTVNEHGFVHAFSLVDNTPARIIAELDMSNLEFYQKEDSLYSYNRMTGVLSLVGTNLEWSLSLEPGLIDFFDIDYPVFCPTKYEIMGCDRLLVKSDCRVTALAVTKRYRSLVFCTADGRVHFHSMKDGNEVSVVQLKSSISRIVITDSWGFVLLASDTDLYVYNVNGSFVRSCKLSHPIVQWTAFTSHSSFDYIAFGDLSGRVGYFEAFYPSQMVYLCESRDLLNVHYDTTTQRLVSVTANGQARMLSHVLA